MRVAGLAAFLIALLAWLSPAAAQPALHQAASRGRVTVYAEAGLDDEAIDLAAGAEAALERIGADLVELPQPTAIEVRLVRDAADLPGIAPAGRGAPAWAVGVAYPDLAIVSVALRRGTSAVDAQATLRHELGHIALGVALGERAPRWLHEGFAYQHAGEWTWERTETLAGMAWFGGIVPLNQLDATFPAAELPANRAYAQSYDFVGFLSRRGRYEDKADDGDRWPFKRFLAEIGHTGDLDAAAKTAYGKKLGELFDEWKSDLTTRYMLVPIGLFGLALWIACAILLALAFWRRRRLNRKRLDAWEAQERAEDAAIAAQVEALSGVPPQLLN
jgi:hypothetical protein